MGFSFSQFIFEKCETAGGVGLCKDGPRASVQHCPSSLVPSGIFGPLNEVWFSKQGLEWSTGPRQEFGGSRLRSGALPVSQLGNRWLLGDSRRCLSHLLSHFCVSSTGLWGKWCGCRAPQHGVTTVLGRSRQGSLLPELAALVALPLQGGLQTFEGRADGLSGRLFGFLESCQWRKSSRWKSQQRAGWCPWKGQCREPTPVVWGRGGDWEGGSMARERSQLPKANVKAWGRAHVAAGQSAAVSCLPPPLLLPGAWIFCPAV